MLEESKKNFATGVSRVKWIASFLAERTREETAKVKGVYKKSRLENRKEDLYSTIGRRVHELSETGGTGFHDDRVIQQALAELRDIGKSANDHPMKAEAPGKHRE